MKTVNIKKELYIVKLNVEKLNIGQYISKNDIPNFENDATVIKINHKIFAGNFTIYNIDAIII